MKVIHISATAKQNAVQGAGWVSTIAKEYKKKYANSEVEIWQIVPGLTSVETVLGNDGLTYVFFPGKILHLNYAESAFFLEWFDCDKFKSSVFHIHGQLRGVASDFVYGFSNKVNIIFSFWGPINIKQTEWHDKRVNNLKCVTFCNSHQLADFKKSYHGETKELTVGVDTVFFKPLDKHQARSEISVTMDRFVMVMVARFIKWKQIIEFLSVLEKSEKDFLLLLVGDGPLRNEITQAAEGLIEKDKVRMLGSLPRESNEIRQVLNASDLFVTVSNGEGASGAVMEALACGLPVLSTDFGGTVDFLKKVNSGCVVAVDDLEQWGKVIDKILEGELIVKPAERHDVVKTYSWLAICEKLDQIYCEAQAK